MKCLPTSSATKFFNNATKFFLPTPSEILIQKCNNKSFKNATKFFLYTW